MVHQLQTAINAYEFDLIMILALLTGGRDGKQLLLKLLLTTPHLPQFSLKKMDTFLRFLNTALNFNFFLLPQICTNLITLGLSGSPHLQLFTSLSQNSNLEVGISINLPDCK